MKKSDAQIEEIQNEYFNFYKNHSFYKKYIGNIDLSKYKYLKFEYDNPTGPSAGLKDLSFQYALCCKLAYILNLKFIASKGTLCPKHNNGEIVEFILSDYYDINSIKINGKKIFVLESEESVDPKEILILKGLTRVGDTRVIDLRKMLGEEKFPFPPPLHLFPQNNNYKDLANNFILRNQIEGGMHIRRGDRLKVGNPPKISKKEWDLGTRSKNILDFLDSKNAPRLIYIATDMTKSDPIIKELKDSKKYKFLFLYDFDDLKLMKKENNYKVFNLEMSIITHNLLKFSSQRFEPILFYKDKIKKSV